MIRRAIRISGIVQGVGFRPFVYDLASRLGLRGFVSNRTGSVLIEVEGKAGSVESFLEELTSRGPPLARIDRAEWTQLELRGDAGFRIAASETDGETPIFVSPDVATCDECLRELFDPADRRYLYPFTNCTNCGPRLTILSGTPYDRERTTMAPFTMCPPCQKEYDDPRDRRFHAQPNACPACGPRLVLLTAEGEPPATRDPLARTLTALRAGRIVAVKGLGGYHLACDASSERAVSELRRRKHRDEKPFAVMARDVTAASALCEVSAVERALLESPRRPIVLLRRRPDCRVAEAVAPQSRQLGVMLPSTPLHHLLMRDLEGLPLVMTSGNRTDEPIAFDDREATERLAGIADLFLANDRRIHVRCDDSVTREVAGNEMLIRRSRGHAPLPLPLALVCRRATLAVGGQLKATFALGRRGHAFVSHHLGDLDHYEAYRVYGETIRHYERLFAIEPERIVCDLHPDYASTRYALERAAADDLESACVQHHWAHVASCMAEHHLEGRVIGVVFDGTGFGVDGAVWGGEFLLADYRGFQRAAHLEYVPMPGGEQAIREPWRMAMAHLAHAAGGGHDRAAPRALLEGVPHAAIDTVERLIARPLRAPPTSSAGRLFDAVAAIAGVRRRVSYEAQAAMELEWLASGFSPDGVYPFELYDAAEGDPPARVLRIETGALVAAAAKDARDGVEPGRIGRRFHTTLVEMVARVCEALAERTGVQTVVLTGGVFANAILAAETAPRLGSAGFRVYSHRLVPPNDGGLSLGQLAIAAAGDDD